MLLKLTRNLLRWLLYLALAVVGVLGSLYAWLVYVNWDDDPLDPAVVAVLEQMPTQISVERNGYFAWIGVMAPEDAAPHEWGQRWHERALTADAANVSGIAEPATPQPEEQRIEHWPDPGPCRKSATCLDDVAADPELVRTLLAGVRLTLERADAAVAYPEYQEPARPNFGLASEYPRYPTVWMPASGARFALDVVEGRHAEALSRMSRELQFHTAQAIGAESLLDKVLALAFLKNDYLLLAAYARRYPEELLARHEQIETMLAPLPAAATSLSMPLRSEGRAMVRLLRNLRQAGLVLSREAVFGHDGGWRGLPSDWLLLPLYLPNATANEIFVFQSRQIQAELLDSDADYRKALDDADEAREAYRDSLLTGLVMRNLVGRILAGVASVNFRSYLLRRDDLLAVRAAVAWRQAQRLAGDPAGWQDQASSSPELIHRMTGTGPQWDAASQALVYEAHPQRKDGGVLRVPL